MRFDQTVVAVTSARRHSRSNVQSTVVMYAYCLRDETIEMNQLKLAKKGLEGLCYKTRISAEAKRINITMSPFRRLWLLLFCNLQLAESGAGHKF
jgi:hypothetical protein